MFGHGDYHTKWSKSDRKRQISYDIAYMQNLKKMIQMNFLQNRNRLTDLENKLIVTRLGGRDRLGDWDWHVHTAIFKTDNQEGPMV